MCKPCRNGKEGWGVYPGVDAVLLLPLLLAVRVCSVCKGGGEIEGLVSIILRAMPVRWVSLRPCLCGMVWGLVLPHKREKNCLVLVTW